jgi:triacylglycerol esterase/lipase EstA (alpha/beta hydrolase family)
VPAHHVLLVPGFFGFTNLGEFAYFSHVQEYLREVLPAAGVRGEVLAVPTAPTASLRRRAAMLADAVAAAIGTSDATVSVVGHSSGGLDARLLVTPEVSLPTQVDVERCARAVRTVVTISTPHHGTPVAHFFNSLLGQQLLKLLSLATIYTLRAGRLPIGAVLRLAGLVRRRDAPPGGVLEQLYTQLLADFSPERRRALDEFFGHLGKDQDLVAQITPAAADLFNASTQDRPGVRYGCVVSRARAPGIRSAITAGLGAYAQATHALYVGLHRVAARTGRDRVPRINGRQAVALRRAYLLRPDRRANDGMVPTLSQVRGDVVHAALADHLDVIGHFHLPTHVPPHFDWLASGCGFDRPQFERCWDDVAAYVGAG